VGLAECYDFLDGLKQRVLFRDRLHVIGRPNHPVFRLPTVSWTHLAQYPWVYRSLADKGRSSRGSWPPRGVNLPRQLTECGSIDFTKSLVAESDHLALCAAHAVGSDVSEGRIKLLSIPKMKREIAVIFRERSPLDGTSRELVAQIEAVGCALGRAVSVAAAKPWKHSSLARFRTFVDKGFETSQL